MADITTSLADTCTRCGQPWPGKWSESIALTRNRMTARLCGVCIRALERDRVSVHEALLYLTTPLTGQRR